MKKSILTAVKQSDSLTVYEHQGVRVGMSIRLRGGSGWSVEADGEFWADKTRSPILDTVRSLSVAEEIFTTAYMRFVKERSRNLLDLSNLTAYVDKVITVQCIEDVPHNSETYNTKLTRSKNMFSTGKCYEAKVMDMGYSTGEIVIYASSDILENHELLYVSEDHGKLDDKLCRYFEDHFIVLAVS